MKNYIPAKDAKVLKVIFYVAMVFWVLTGPS